MQKLNIPKKIHVGYQDRNGTYTGKLAYVIYTDDRGKRRKERSWNSWRDNKIDVDDFDNEPTTGFVLNKGVGGQRESWGWNARNEYIRVYDPRGFEFEISVANLLFILTNCSAIKGKGLEGEFVYAWDKAELILLPVDCFEYKTSSEFTSLQTKKVTKKEMKEGLTYKHKDTTVLVYVGRHKIRNLDEYSYYYDSVHPLLQEADTPRHVFYDVENDKWRFERGFTRLAEVVSEDQHPEFANLYTKFISSKYVCEVGEVILSPIATTDLTTGHHRSSWFYIKVDGGYQLAYLTRYRPRTHWDYPWRSRQVVEPDIGGMTNDHFWPTNPVVLTEVTINNLCNRYGSRYDDERYAVSESYLADKELLTPEIQLKSKETVEIYGYVKRRKNSRVPKSC